MNDTIVAISTTMGVGAISIIRVSGNEAIDIVSSCFKGKDLRTVDSHPITYGYIYDSNTTKNGVFYLEIAANKVKDTLADINITIPALTNTTTAGNIDSDWIVLYSNSKPGQATVGYEIKKVNLTDPATIENTITVTASELLEKTNVNKTAASYIILSSNTTFSNFDKIKLQYTGGTVTKATTLAEVKAIKAETNTIVYLTANYRVKYIPLSSKHIYKCINYAECSVPRFLLYDSIPAESMIGEPLDWVEDIEGGMWEVPGKKGETKYLAYSYKEDGAEPIIEDYTLEYYLPKLYANKSSNWEQISDWFKVPYVDRNNIPLLTYYNNNPNVANLSLEHIKNYSANKKVYYLKDEEYIELNELPKIYFKEETFNEDKNNKTVLQIINGVDTEVKM